MKKRREVIITLDFHFGLKKCTDASSVVIVWKDADIKEALTPSFSPVFPQQIFCSSVSELRRFQEKEEDAFCFNFVELWLKILSKVVLLKKLSSQENCKFFLIFYSKRTLILIKKDLIDHKKVVCIEIKRLLAFVPSDFWYEKLLFSLGCCCCCHAIKSRWCSDALQCIMLWS